MAALAGWVLLLALLNYWVFCLTGVPVVWHVMLVAAEPLKYYAQILSLILVLGVVVAGALRGFRGAMMVSLALLALHFVPLVLAAVFDLGVK